MYREKLNGSSRPSRTARIKQSPQKKVQLVYIGPLRYIFEII